MVKYSNNSVSTLLAEISIGATSFSVQSGDGTLFPILGAGEYCFLRIGDDGTNEVANVTARSGDVFTCDALSSGWSINTPVIGSVNEDLLDAFLQIDNAEQTVSGFGIKKYFEVLDQPSISTGVLTLDMTNGNVFDVVLDENVTTVNFNNPPASGKVGNLSLFLKQDATGGYSIVWPSSVKWASGTAPTLSTSANMLDILVFFTIDGGTNWYGSLGGVNFS